MAGVSRPYTGPTGLVVENSQIRIEGYPDAERLAELTSPLARRLGHLRLHQQMLLFAKAGFEALAIARLQFPTAADAILAGVVTRFFSCFGENKSAAPLSAQKIFKSEPNAMECFSSWKALRDKHFAHNESELSFLKTTVVLGPEADVQDIVSLNLVISITAQEEFCQTLGELIDIAMRWVDGQAAEVVTKLFEETRALTVRQRHELPSITYATPKAETAFEKRAR